MKIIGIVGRVYLNIDNQEIIQLNDYLRKILSKYDDVISILLLPTNADSYVSMGMGNDKLKLEDKNRLDYILNKCDGFIIPGGSYWYNFDEYIINYAIKTNKPLLGICAGFQVICSMFSKNRTKFDMTEKITNDNHYGRFNAYQHEIIITKDSLLEKILNKNRILVNSLHHYCVNFTINKLNISALSPDNIIESVELNNHKFFLAIQWHPEYLNDDNSKKIFDYFVEKIKTDY